MCNSSLLLDTSKFLVFRISHINIMFYKVTQNKYNQQLTRGSYRIILYRLLRGDRGDNTINDRKGEGWGE